jgi:hypothetical protein
MHTGMTRRLECAVLCCAVLRVDPDLGREGGWCKVGGMTAYLPPPTSPLENPASTRKSR